MTVATTARCVRYGEGVAAGRAAGVGGPGRVCMVR
jgi:hypothetical protein